MSRPTEEQAEQITDRVGILLDEWDDARYVLAVKRNDDNWCFRTHASPFQKMVVARGLLEEAIDHCMEDPEIDQ
jgi:hypothetical protein